MEVDLDAIMPARPDAIMLPKAEGGGDVGYLDHQLTLRERRGTSLRDYKDFGGRHRDRKGNLPSRDLCREETAAQQPHLGAAQNLAASIGTESKHDADGRYIEPFCLAPLCLFGTVTAGAQPINSVYPPFHYLEGLRRLRGGRARGIQRQDGDPFGADRNH
ncbi:hypothetical protein ACWX0O_24295 (plasmid) [Nitrobacteraceae bacterium UC4449_H16]